MLGSPGRLGVAVVLFAVLGLHAKNSVSRATKMVERSGRIDVIECVIESGFWLVIIHTFMISTSRNREEP